MDLYQAKEDARIPVRWSAPEVLFTGEFTSKADVFSFAITVYEIFTNAKLPYGTMDNEDVGLMVAMMLG